MQIRLGWIGTSDEIKKGGVFVSWFLDRKIITLKESIEREKEENGEALKGTGWKLWLLCGSRSCGMGRV
jgi:hypothetical protein